MHVLFFQLITGRNIAINNTDTCEIKNGRSRKLERPFQLIFPLHCKQDRVVVTVQVTSRLERIRTAEVF